MDKINLWLWLSENGLMTKNIKHHLLEHFGDIESIYSAKRPDYEALDWLQPEQITSLCDKDARDMHSLYKQNGVTIVTLDSDEYPDLLRQAYMPPLVLYCRGKFINLNERLCISMVGTRKMTVYGKNCAYNISKELAESGVIIVSGMADGIDSVAHRGALDAGMPTVAIIGCGVNIVYPKKNASLMKKIMETGMVVSEYPLNSPPEKFHFPERNIIIAALSAATVVVEADIKSGSLITANRANELGKDLYAVPGSIYSLYSKGTNAMIKDGAYCATCAEDILFGCRARYADLLVAGMNDRIENNNIESTRDFKTLEQEYVQKTNAGESDETLYGIDSTPFEGDEAKILKLITDKPISADFIHEKTGMDIGALNSRLLLMELSGKITKHPGNTYTISN